MKIRLADYLASLLAQNNIHDVFTITGGGAMHLNDAFGKHPKLKCYYNHHEQACAIAAEGYARLENKIALVCVTTGPGGTNAITGVLGGYYDSIPMLVISGQVKYSTTTSSTHLPLRQLGDQECNIVKLVESITKYAVMITNPNDIKYELEKALFIAKSGRPGPVWLDIPINIQSAIIETENLRSFDRSEIEEKYQAKPISEKQIDQVIKLINQAKKPVIMVGTGVRIAGAQKAFLEFINKNHIPVVTGFNAHDLIAYEHPYFFGKPGTVGDRAGNFVVQNADLILVVGCRLNIRQISYNYENFAKKAFKVMVDVDNFELDKPTLNIDFKICGDAKNFFELLNVKKICFNNIKWINYCNAVKSEFDVVEKSYYDESKPLNPYVFARALSLQSPSNSTTVCSNGSAVVISFQAARIKEKQRLFSNSGVASMGYGLPASIGAAVATKNNLTICLEGDGSLQMNIQELITLAQNQLNIKVFVYNNGGYHSIRQTQNNFFGKPLVGIGPESNDLSFPDLELLAKAYHLKFYSIQTIKDLEKIEVILKENGPALIDVVVDPEQPFSPKLSSKKLPDGKMISTTLDDMFPFLEDEVYKKFTDI